ncbi:MAG TPA: molecular chaperone GroEL, partial [Maribacter sp.]|nr:molecular chaperone GroEL [Maribacter sp.]
ALIMNTVRGSMRVAAVKAPGFGRERKEILSDLAMAVGATFVTRGSSPKLEDLKLKHLGKAKTIEVQKNSTTIVDGNGDWELIEERIESIKSEIKQTEDMRECKRLQHRISRLQSGVAIIEVGAASEVEMVEKKHRIEDALEAVRAAQSSGIVPGGGAALVSCISFLPKNLNNSESFGREVLKKAMLAPITQISKNCGVSPDLVIDSVMRQNKRKKSSNYGYNFVTNKVVDMFEEGIIDPAKVTITALKNAVSVVSTLLTTATCIIQEQNES